MKNAQLAQILEEKELYHPSKIYEAKREVSARELPKIELNTNNPSQSPNKSESEPEENRPEGVAGILFDSAKYLRSALKSFRKIRTQLQRFEQVTIQSLDNSMPDTKRRPLNKEAQKLKREIDRLAREELVEGDLLFSGRFSLKGKILPISLEKKEEINLRLEGHTSEYFGIQRAKIDTLPMAKKTHELLARGKERCADTDKLLSSKLETIEFKLNQIKHSKEEGDKANASGSKQSYDDFKYDYLREKQEKAAVAKGRTSALLINIKV